MTYNVFSGMLNPAQSQPQSVQLTAVAGSWFLSNCRGEKGAEMQDQKYIHAGPENARLLNDGTFAK